ncbi:cytochrome c553 [Paraburkholderia sp. MM6662-R1]
MLAPDIVAHGAPLRNIPACAACHGGIDHKVGSPWLDGLPAAYTKAQLQAFADGTRHNDISGQMRNIARNMTSAEMAEAASWYANLTR